MPTGPPAHTFVLPDPVPGGIPGSPGMSTPCWVPQHRENLSLLGAGGLRGHTRPSSMAGGGLAASEAGGPPAPEDPSPGRGLCGARGGRPAFVHVRQGNLGQVGLTAWRPGGREGTDLGWRPRLVCHNGSSLVLPVPGFGDMPWNRCPGPRRAPGPCWSLMRTAFWVRWVARGLCPVSVQLGPSVSEPGAPSGSTSLSLGWAGCRGACWVTACPTVVTQGLLQPGAHVSWQTALSPFRVLPLETSRARRLTAGPGWAVCTEGACEHTRAGEPGAA